MECSNGHDNPEDRRFCGECGEVLEAAPETTDAGEVSGDRRLDSLLVSLDPAAEIAGPPGCRERQRAHAARLLQAYTD